MSASESSAKRIPVKEPHPDYVPIDNIESVKFALSEKLKIEKYTCTELPFSGVTDEKIAERLQIGDTAFFSEEYLLFLINPEEAGSAFQMSGSSHAGYSGVINMGLIKQVNQFVQKLPESVKQVMISKVDNYMVPFNYSRERQPEV